MWVAPTADNAALIPTVVFAHGWIPSMKIKSSSLVIELCRDDVELSCLCNWAHMIFLTQHFDDAVVRHGPERAGKIARFASGRLRE